MATKKYAHCVKLMCEKTAQNMNFPKILPRENIAKPILRPPLFWGGAWIFPFSKNLSDLLTVEFPYKLMMAGSLTTGLHKQSLRDN